MQLGEPVPLVVLVGVLGDRPASRFIVVVGDVTHRRGEGSHRVIASVLRAGGELLDHRSQRFDGVAVSQRGGHCRSERGVIEVVALVRSGPWVDGQLAADERRRVAGQPAGVGRNRSHVRARRVEERCRRRHRLVGATGHAEHVDVEPRLELGHHRRNTLDRQTGDGSGGLVGFAAQRGHGGDHHPGEEPQHRLVVGGDQ